MNSDTGAVGSAALARRLARLERLLGGIQKVLNHDLPNQVVIVQGLVKLLALEDTSGLGVDAQEYLRRLTGAAERLGGMVKSLKSLGQAGLAQENPEAVELRDLFQEATLQIKQLFPGTVIEYHLPVDLGPVRAGPGSLRKALLELLTLAVETRLWGREAPALGARLSQGAVDLWLGRSGAPPAPRPPFSPL